LAQNKTNTESIDITDESKVRILKSNKESDYADYSFSDSNTEMKAEISTFRTFYSKITKNRRLERKHHSTLLADEIEVYIGDDSLEKSYDLDRDFIRNIDPSKYIKEPLICIRDDSFEEIHASDRQFIQDIDPCKNTKEAIVYIGDNSFERSYDLDRDFIKVITKTRTDISDNSSEGRNECDIDLVEDIDPSELIHDSQVYIVDDAFKEKHELYVDLTDISDFLRDSQLYIVDEAFEKKHDSDTDLAKDLQESQADISGGHDLERDVIDPSEFICDSQLYIVDDAFSERHDLDRDIVKDLQEPPVYISGGHDLDRDIIDPSEFIFDSQLYIVDDTLNERYDLDRDFIKYIDANKYIKEAQVYIGDIELKQYGNDRESIQNIEADIETDERERYSQQNEMNIEFRVSEVGGLEVLQEQKYEKLSMQAEEKEAIKD
jgi:hypothetical protein